jgi:glycosyltransferase involved in cell wall biosynthesis
VDPNDHDAFGESLERIVTDLGVWESYSRAGQARVREAFNWDAHASKVLHLANTYSYWNYLDVMNRQALDQYIHTLYHTIFRPRAHAMTQEK